MAEAPRSPPIHDAAPQNRCYLWSLGDEAATNAAFAKAAHVTKLDLTNNRLIPNALEPRAPVASDEQATQEITLYTTSQNPHLERLVLAAFVNLAPEHKLRRVAPHRAGGLRSPNFILLA